MSDTDNFKSINPDGSFEYVLDESGLHETMDEQVRPSPPIQSEVQSKPNPGGSKPVVAGLVAVALVAALGVGAFLLFGGTGDGESAGSDAEESAGFKPYAGGGAATEPSAKPIEVATAPEEDEEEEEEVVIEESEPVPDEPGWDLEEPEEVPVEVEVVEEVVDDSEEEEVAELEEVEEPELEERPRPIRVPRDALRNTMITPMRPKMPTPTIVSPQLGNTGSIPIRRINPQTGKLEVQQPDIEEGEEEVIE